MSEGVKRGITLKDAIAYVSTHVGRQCRKEFNRRFYADGHEILVLGYSCETGSMPGFPNPPRMYRLSVFVDGKPQVGTIISP